VYQEAFDMNKKLLNNTRIIYPERSEQANTTRTHFLQRSQPSAFETATTNTTHPTENVTTVKNNFLTRPTESPIPIYHCDITRINTPLSPTNDSQELLTCMDKAYKTQQVEAQLQLASMYLEDKTKPDNELKAAYLLVGAAEQGHAGAQFAVAKLYMHGYGVAFDYQLALHYVELAANQGHTEAQYIAGQMYSEGTHLVKNLPKAMAYYRSAAEKGFTQAQYELAIMCKNGIGMQINLKQAYDLYSVAANKGHSGAQHALAMMYHKGQHVPKDTQIAKKLYTLAARQGHPEANGVLMADVKPNIALTMIEISSYYYKRGNQYLAGDGVTKDPLEAEALYKVAADQGNPLAQHMLGIFYSSDRYVAKNVTTAEQFFILAANQGYAPSQLALIKLYFDTNTNTSKIDGLLMLASKQGVAVAQYLIVFLKISDEHSATDSAEIIHYCQLAATNSSLEAQMQLASWYEEGVMVTRNADSAFQFYKLAENQGDETAAFKVGEMHILGIGTKQDLTEACVHLERAAKKGHEKAQKILNEIRGTRSSSSSLSTLSTSSPCFPSSPLDTTMNNAPRLYDASTMGQHTFWSSTRKEQALATALGLAPQIRHDEQELAAALSF